jgi:hypothetical protein
MIANIPQIGSTLDFNMNVIPICQCHPQVHTKKKIVGEKWQPFLFHLCTKVSKMSFISFAVHFDPNPPVKKFCIIWHAFTFKICATYTTLQLSMPMIQFIMVQ